MKELNPERRIQKTLQNADVVYLAGFLLILISLVINIIDRSPQTSSRRFAAGLGCIGVVFIVHLLRPLIAARTNRPARMNIAALVLMDIFILGSTWFSPSITGDAYLLMFVVGTAFRLLTGLAAAALTAASVALWLLIPYSYYGAEILLDLSLSITFALVFFIAIGWLVRRNTQQLEHARKLTLALQQANDELTKSRLRERDLAAAEERVRLAREIHDGLGHHLTTLSVQLQAAEVQLEKDPAAAGEAIEICRQEAQHALEEVRRSVAVMRSSPLDGTSLEEALARLVRDFTWNTSLVPVFDLVGKPIPLDHATALTCYRAVQEGLTNVQKHARDPREVRVHLEYAPREVLIEVIDDGSASPGGESGYGLMGLQERAAQLGGQFRAEPIPSGGFALQLRLPIGGDHD